MYIYCSYIPPDKSNDIAVYQAHVNAIDFIRNRSNPADVFLVGGDFNLPKLRWTQDEENPLVLVPNAVSAIEICACDGIAGVGLHQINSLFNGNGRLLNLIYCSLSADIRVLASEFPLVKEDIPHHFATEILLDLPVNCPETVDDTEERIYDFKKADFDKLSAYISEFDFHSQFQAFNNLNDMVMYFYYILFIGIEWFVPTRKIKLSRHPPWYNRSLIRLLNQKNKAFRRYASSGRCATLYKYLRKRFVNYQNFLYNDYLSKIQRNLKVNPKSFFEFAKFKSKTPGIPALMSYEDVAVTGISNICKLFACYFESVYRYQETGH